MSDTDFGEVPAKNADGESPLQTPWSIWYDRKLPRGAPSSAYEENLKRIGTFDTIESFWRHFVHLKRPSELAPDVNYYLFRNQLVPMWETFPDGGCWILKVRNKAGVMSKLWQDLVFAAIGEVFAEPKVVGVVLAMRSRDSYIAVWHDGAASARARLLIGEKLKSVLELEANTIIEYKPHKKSIKDGSTYRNAKPFVFAEKPRSRAPSVASAAGSAAGSAAKEEA